MHKPLFAYVHHVLCLPALHALTSESLSAFSPMIKVPAICQLSPDGKEPSALKQQSDLKSLQAQLSTSLKQSQSQAVGQGQALAQGRAHGQDKVHEQSYEQGQVQGKSQLMMRLIPKR